MSILDKTKIGNLVKVNLKLSKDRLDKEIIEALNISSIGKISDFRITDGKGIGVILKLTNGKEQWFFEDEIDLLDEDGNLIKNIKQTSEDNSLLINFLKRLNYQKKNKVSELLNPVNFFLWLTVSLKDVF